MTPVSSMTMTAGQFWNALKTEADAVSWNLRDIKRGQTTDIVRMPSLDRAIESSERIVSMISGRMEEFRKQISERRYSGGRK